MNCTCPEMWKNSSAFQCRRYQLARLGVGSENPPKNCECECHGPYTRYHVNGTTGDVTPGGWTHFDLDTPVRDARKDRKAALNSPRNGIGSYDPNWYHYFVKNNRTGEIVFDTRKDPLEGPIC